METLRDDLFEVSRTNYSLGWLHVFLGLGGRCSIESDSANCHVRDQEALKRAKKQQVSQTLGRLSTPPSAEAD